MGIKIIATGRYVPERVLTNADLEKMVETSDEWIRTRTGIETRHIADASQATSDMCREAAKNALEIPPNSVQSLLRPSLRITASQIPHACSRKRSERKTLSALTSPPRVPA